MTATEKLNLEKDLRFNWETHLRNRTFPSRDQRAVDAALEEIKRLRCALDAWEQRKAEK